MAFIENNLIEASAYGDITSDGSFCIRNIPEGPVRLVLRPDTETILELPDASQNGNPMVHVKGRSLTTEEISAGRFDFAPPQAANTDFTKITAGLSEADRHLLLGAFSKYGKPRGEHAVKTRIALGPNRLDIDFKVP